MRRSRDFISPKGAFDPLFKEGSSTKINDRFSIVLKPLYNFQFDVQYVEVYNEQHEDWIETYGRGDKINKSEGISDLTKEELNNLIK